MATDSATYYSLDQFADAVQDSTGHRDKGDWSGNVTWDEALILARMGWDEQLSSAMEVAESAITMAEQEHLTDTFRPMWDVAGDEVDVGRFLSGEPECMIRFPVTRTSTAGRVITMCASMSYSGSISAATIRKRGQAIVALAMALSKLGHNTELWMDLTGQAGKGTVKVRVLVKGANDELDPARIMFAFAHPAMLRQLGFAAIGLLGYSPAGTMPVPPERDLPEGTIYLPELRSSHDVPNADQFLRKYLGELGLLSE